MMQCKGTIVQQSAYFVTVNLVKEKVDLSNQIPHAIAIAIAIVEVTKLVYHIRQIYAHYSYVG